MTDSLELRGQPVAPGIALGPVHLLRRTTRKISREIIDNSLIDSEIKRLGLAIDRARIDIETQRSRAMSSLGEIVARIFDAHLMILDDDVTMEQVRELIREDRFVAEYGLWRIFDQIARQFDSLKDPMFRDRAQDVRDVCSRLLDHLCGSPEEQPLQVDVPSILVADELSPSDVLRIDPTRIIGVVTDIGGSTSHTAILTRVLGVPSVVGLRDITKKAKPSDLIAVNGNSGKIFLRPDDDQIVKYKAKQTQHKEFILSLKDIDDKPAETIDGHRVELAGNIELSSEAERISSYGGEGVGLFRTEYLFLSGGGIPSEDEQTKEYTRVAIALKGKPVVIRTFDLGGDKAFPGAGIPPEANPFLGWRAIRFGLDRPETLEGQLRAILRASVHGNIKVMFPMIGNLDELLQAKELLKSAKAELRNQEIPFNEEIEVGMMVEVPSAAIMAREFAKHVDFLSIGTNDLTQFVLAVDRGNAMVADLHSPYHPAVLHLIKQTVDAGHEAGIWVGLCGEFAGDPAATLLLLGLGLDEFSTSPPMIPEIKKLIRSASLEESKEFAKNALRAKTATEVRNTLLQGMRRKFSDLPIWFGEKDN